jgi:L-ascorbate metabolism protein UlaG (beta-lactamase superfamily)
MVNCEYYVARPPQKDNSIVASKPTSMRLILLLLLCGFLTRAQNSDQIEIFYVGNMGVAIVKNDSVILVDALHDYYDVYYLPTDTAILSKIRKHLKPYQTLVAVIATHMHKDHFDEALITQLSQQVPNSKTIMGKQPSESLGQVNAEQLQIVNQSGTVQLKNGLSVSMKNVGHIGARHETVENYRIEIKWGEHRFIHFGDAAPTSKTFEGLIPDADVGIVPNWFCFDAKDIALLEKQKFRKIIATHIEPTGLRNAFGKSAIEIIPFLKYGQSVKLK